MYTKLLGIISVGFSRTHQLLIFFLIYQLLEKELKCNERVYQLFRDFKKTYVAVRRKVVYSNLLEFGAPIKLVSLIKICFVGTSHILTDNNSNSLTDNRQLPQRKRRR
jgi:hypothetical protein